MPRFRLAFVIPMIEWVFFFQNKNMKKFSFSFLQTTYINPEHNGVMIFGLFKYTVEVING